MILSFRINSLLLYLIILVFIPSISSQNSSSKISQDPNDVHFYLYPFKETPEIYEEIIYNSTESLKKSSYRSDKKLVLLVHGFMNDGFEKMPQTIKNAYFQTDLDYNYIVVDWGNLSAAGRGGPSRVVTGGQYLIVTRNAPVVAKRIADFLTFLESNNMIMSFREVHLVGHSLGAHIGGQVGARMQRSSRSQKKLGRITGLDPAGPLFQPSISSSSWAIGKSDADFVDIIHTNGGVLGTTSADGHVDIFVDGGRKIEGCCSKNESVTALAINASYSPSDTATQIFGFCNACSHFTAFRIYAASLQNEMYGCKCNRFESKALLPPICLSDCADRILVGYNCPPTARGHYGLKLKT